MGVIQGDFTYGGLPRNNVTAKLWQAGKFSSAPQQDTALPSGSPTSSTTTGTTHGGAGAYRFSGVADGAYYVSFEYAGSIVYEYKTAGPLSADDYGAMGDGTTDDAVALQAAITAASGGGVVYLPPGNYRITTGLTIPSSNIKIIGAGRGVTTITFAGSSGTAIKSSDQATGRAGIELRGFTLTGSGGTAVGIDLKSLSDCLLADIDFSNFATCLNIDGSVTGYYSTYLHLKFSASLASGQTAINIGEAGNAHAFLGCRFHRFAKHVVIGSGTTSIPNQVQFLSCHWESAETTSIDLVKGQGIRFLGGRWEGNAIALTLASSNDAREIIFDPDYVLNNTTLISGQYTALTQPGGASKGPLAFQWGYSQAPADNRVPNGLMEGWASASDLMGWSSLNGTNWDTTGFETREGTIKKNGSFAAKIGNGSNNDRGISTTNKIAVRADLQYTLSFWFTSPETTTGLRYGFRCFDSGGSVITTGTVVGMGIVGEAATGATSLAYSATYNAHVLGSDGLPTQADTYQRLGGVFKFPSGTVEVRLGFWVVGSGGTKYAYVDDVAFCEGPTPIVALGRPVYDSGDQSVFGKVLASSGLGVGNSAAGSSLGSVTKKIEVFDAAGASLGFVAVYDAIT